jgi:ethanolamine utilization protein EutA
MLNYRIFSGSAFIRLPSSNGEEVLNLKDQNHHHSHDHNHEHSHDHFNIKFEPDDDHYYDHHHHELELEEDLESNPLWLADNIQLISVGIDIGSAGTQVIFSKLWLRRKGEDLSSRYVVVKREPMYLSPVTLTPYVSDDRIDNNQIGKIIDQAYNEAGITPDDVDTGVVLLTGEAMRRENAQAIGEVIAAHGGKFVCAAAGHNMEALLAAYGSKAALVSFENSSRILNLDIGGGTTKLAVVENGKVLETAAFYIGGRLIVVDENQRIVRLDPGGKDLAKQIGYDWNVGDTVTREQMRQLTAWMAKAVVAAIQQRPLQPEIEKLFLTPLLHHVNRFDGIMFSGGVAEYIYDRETRDFGDLGLLLGEALRKEMEENHFPWPVFPAGECIRATVVGASQYSVQVSGNTNFIPKEGMLPVKNLQVLHPRLEVGEHIDPDQVAQSIRQHFSSFDLTEGEVDIALAFRWNGDPSYERIFAFAQGIKQAMSNTIENGKALIVVLDGDIGRTLGKLLRDELGMANDILSIDGIMLQDFDFIDIGRVLYPSETVPVTVKSLVFHL